MKTGIGASLPEDLFAEFNRRSEGFPGGKTGLIKEALRAYFSANPVPSVGEAAGAVTTTQEQPQP